MIIKYNNEIFKFEPLYNNSTAILRIMKFSNFEVFEFVNQISFENKYFLSDLDILNSGLNSLNASKNDITILSSHKPQHDGIIIAKHYDDRLAKAYLNSGIIVFGDNLQRAGHGGQACIRDYPNAFGIATKKSPAKSYNAYFSDDEYGYNIEVIESDIQKIIIHSAGKTLIFPKTGIGTGMAQLPQKAPKTYDYLCKRLKELFNYDNSGKSY